MNMVSINFKSILLGLGGAIAMTAVFASVQMYQPAKLQPEEPISIVSDQYSVESLDLGRYNDCTSGCLATVSTSDRKFHIDVNFDYSSFDDGNGFIKEFDVEVDRLEPIVVIDDESGEAVNAYIDRIEISKINDSIEVSVNEKLRKLGG
ncbi:hypothetical protein [Acinetobacter chinensis]|uniref:hypothetical protein n=1 Tax=Acinetobacter chinensis TaxID=2004650 RepID=UPI002935077A|nr:hypothetical protein [Acinetobacter chinensis]WOE40103.1 hypothetical protein QSG87_09270 [Acinetobacter chinensis]